MKRKWFSEKPLLHSFWRMVFMILLFLFFINQTILQSFQQGMLCPCLSTCQLCSANKNCGWCSMTLQCMDIETIRSYCLPHGELMLLGNNETHGSLGFNMPPDPNSFVCDTGAQIVTHNISSCPPFSIDILEQSISSTNLVTSLPYPIKLRIFPLSAGVSNMTKNDLIPGVYSVDSESQRKSIKFFSYKQHVLVNAKFPFIGTLDFLNILTSYHIDANNNQNIMNYLSDINLPSYISDSSTTYGIKTYKFPENNTILVIDDVRIVAPQSTISLGYMVIAKDKETGKMHCGYARATKTVQQWSNMWYIITDPVFIAQFFIFVFAILIISIPLIFCQEHFEAGIAVKLQSIESRKRAYINTIDQEFEEEALESDITPPKIMVTKNEKKKKKGKKGKKEKEEKSNTPSSEIKSDSFSPNSPLQVSKEIHKKDSIPTNTPILDEDSDSTENSPNKKNESQDKIPEISTTAPTSNVLAAATSSAIQISEQINPSSQAATRRRVRGLSFFGPKFVPPSKLSSPSSAAQNSDIGTEKHSDEESENPTTLKTLADAKKKKKKNFRLPFPLIKFDTNKKNSIMTIFGKKRIAKDGKHSDDDEGPAILLEPAAIQKFYETIEGNVLKNFFKSRRNVSTIRDSYLEMMRKMFSISDKELINSCGIDAYYFKKFNERAIVMTFVLCLYSGFLLFIDGTSSDFPNMFLDFAQYTVSALGFKSWNFFWHALSFIIFPVAFLYLKLYLIQLRKKVIRSKDELLHKSTVLVTGIPKKVSEKAFETLVDKYFGKKSDLSFPIPKLDEEARIGGNLNPKKKYAIGGVTISLELSILRNARKKKEKYLELLKNVKQAVEVRTLKKKKELTDPEKDEIQFFREQPFTFQKVKYFFRCENVLCRKCVCVQAIKYYKRKIRKYHEIIKRIQQNEDKLVGTGFGFITFTNRAGSNYFMRHFTQLVDSKKLRIINEKEDLLDRLDLIKEGKMITDGNNNNPQQQASQVQNNHQQQSAHVSRKNSLTTGESSEKNDVLSGENPNPKSRGNTPPMSKQSSQNTLNTPQVNDSNNTSNNALNVSSSNLQSKRVKFDLAAFFTGRKKKIPEQRKLEEGIAQRNAQLKELNMLRKLHLKTAPEPEDVIWQNLSYSQFHRNVVFLLSSIILTVILVVCSAAVFISSFLWFIRDFFKYSVNDVLINLFFNFLNPVQLPFGYILYPMDLLNLVVSQVPPIIAVLNQLFPPLLERFVQFEHFTTRKKLRKSFLFRCIFFMFINSFIIPHVTKYLTYLLAFQLWATDEWKNYHHFYNTTGLEFTRFLTSVLLLAKAGELGVIFFIMMQQLIFTNQIKRPFFMYESNYAFRVIMLCFILLLGPIIPLTTILVFFYLIITYLIDKWLIMYYFKKGKGTDSSYLKGIEKSITVVIICFPPYISCLSIGWFIPSMAVFFPLSYLIIMIFVVFFGLYGRYKKETTIAKEDLDQHREKLFDEEEFKQQQEVKKKEAEAMAKAAEKQQTFLMKFFRYSWRLLFEEDILLGDHKNKGIDTDDEILRKAKLFSERFREDIHTELIIIPKKKEEEKKRQLERAERLKREKELHKTQPLHLKKKIEIPVIPKFNAEGASKRKKSNATKPTQINDLTPNSAPPVESSNNFNLDSIDTSYNSNALLLPPQSTQVSFKDQMSNFHNTLEVERPDASNGAHARTKSHGTLAFGFRKQDTSKQSKENSKQSQDSSKQSSADVFAQFQQEFNEMGGSESLEQPDSPKNGNSGSFSPSGRAMQRFRHNYTLSASPGALTTGHSPIYYNSDENDNTPNSLSVASSVASLLPKGSKAFQELTSSYKIEGGDSSSTSPVEEENNDKNNSNSISLKQTTRQKSMDDEWVIDRKKLFLASFQQQQQQQPQPQQEPEQEKEKLHVEKEKLHAEKDNKTPPSPSPETIISEDTHTQEKEKEEREEEQQKTPKRLPTSRSFDGESPFKISAFNVPDTSPNVMESPKSKRASRGRSKPLQFEEQPNFSLTKSFAEMKEKQASSKEISTSSSSSGEFGDFSLPSSPTRPRARQHRPTSGSVQDLGDTLNLDSQFLAAKELDPLPPQQSPLADKEKERKTENNDVPQMPSPPMIVNSPLLGSTDVKSEQNANNDKKKRQSNSDVVLEEVFI